MSDADKYLNSDVTAVLIPAKKNCFVGTGRGLFSRVV